jgi:hypothetical protein
MFIKTQVILWPYLAQFFLEWEMFHTQSCRENQNTHFVFNNYFPTQKNRAVYKIPWKNVVVGQATDDNFIKRRRFARSIIKVA